MPTITVNAGDDEQAAFDGLRSGDTLAYAPGLTGMRGFRGFRELEDITVAGNGAVIDAPRWGDGVRVENVRGLGVSDFVIRNAPSWKARSQRTRAARAAVCGLLGRHLRAAAGAAEHYHAGGTLRVVLTRLGGQKLDRSNLGGSMKAAEDALCLVLAVDDGDDRWDVTFKQDPDAPAVGVRAEVRPAEGGAA